MYTKGVKSVEMVGGVIFFLVPFGVISDLVCLVLACDNVILLFYL